MVNNLSRSSHCIDEAVNNFLKRINEVSENGHFRKVRKITTAFPMLKLANDEFYEYVYFERTLEWYVRDDLINSVLYHLLEIYGIKYIRPNTKNYVGYNTESIEEIFPFEFIFMDNGEKIGVRYTELCSGEASELIYKYEIDKILQIKWNFELTSLDERQTEYEIIIPEVFLTVIFHGKCMKFTFQR